MLLRNEKRLAILWLMVLTALLIIASFTLPVKINTQILDLLPQQEQNPAIIKSQQALNKNISSNIIWFSQASSAKLSFEKAKAVQSALNESMLFSEVSLSLPATAHNMADALKPFTYHFMTDSDFTLLQQSPDDFLQTRLMMLYGITAMQYSSNLSNDPLFTLGNYLNQFNNSSAQLYNDAAQFKYDDHYYTLIISTLKNNLGLNQQRQLVALHDILTKQSVIASGLPIFSAYGAQSAEHEISTVGTLSLLAIIALIIITFKSPWPLLPTSIAIVFGISAGAIITATIFKEIHVITLVFGSSLMGITVDYAFHYFCDRYRQPNPQAMQSLRHVFPGISLGMISSSMVYGTLILTPFPGLQQIGVFTVSGLIAAWLSVSLLFPLLSNNSKQRAHPAWIANFTMKQQGLIPTQKKLTLSCCILLIIAGLSQLQFHDDIRSLQTPKKMLLEHDKKVRKVSGQNIDSRYFIIAAKNNTELMQKEAILNSKLAQAVDDAKLSSYQALSSFYQSPTQQQKNIALIKQQLVDNQKLSEFLRQLSMSENDIETINKQIIKASQTSLDFEQWLQTLPPPLQQLWLGCDESGCHSVVRLEAVTTDALSEFSELDAGIIWADPVTQINRILSRYRITAISYLLAAFAAIFVILTLSLNIKSAFMILSIPTLSILASLAVLAAFGTSISIFHIFGLMLALGISLDYAVFQHLGKHQHSTVLAIVLSLLTSLLAFGLLSMSETAFIQAFGISLSLGISFAFCLSQIIFSKKLQEGTQHV